MLYASFAVLNGSLVCWFILSYMWGIVFMIRMTVKDISLAKKVGWEEYSQRSWMLVPKIGGSTALSAAFYGVFGALTYAVVQNGGMEASLNLLFNKA